MIYTLKIALVLNCLFIAVWPSVRCSAQNLSNIETPSYSVKHYTDENGLPQNSVKDIVADQDGFIWLTTESGLVRFDGRRFEVFNKANLDISTNRFTSFQPSLDQNDGQIFAVINYDEYVSLNNGKAVVKKDYYSKIQQKIPELQKGVHKIMLTMGSHNAKDWPPLGKYVIPLVGQNGSYYLCSKDRISYFSNWEKSTENIDTLSGFWHLFRQGNNLYALNLDGTFTFYDGPQGHIRRGLKIQGDILKNRLFDKSAQDIKIYWNHTADQIFLYLGKSLYIVEVISPGVLTTRLLLYEFDHESHKISSIFYDKLHQRLFLGSSSWGLFVCTKFSFKTAQINDKSFSNVFYTQAQLKNSLIFPEGYRLEFVEGGSDPIWAINSFLKDKALSRYCFLIDHRKNQWGLNFNQLFRFSSDGKKILNEWISNSDITAIYQSDSNLIWISTITGNLYKFNPSEAKPVPELFTIVPYASRIMNQMKDTLWSGTLNGLYQIILSTKKSQVIKGTESFNIRSIYISYPGEIWFTTYEHGFFLYKNGELFSFQSDSNRFLDTSHCIFEDRNGYFWISTNKGLFRIYKKDLLQSIRFRNFRPYYYYYSKDHGFMTNEFNGGCQPCAVRLDNGLVSFPSLMGVVLFTPENVKMEIPDKDIFIDEVKIGDKKSSFSGDSIYFPFDPQAIQIRVSTPYFGDAYNLHMSYSLKESGRDILTWQALDNSGIIQISSLTSGDYELTIRKQQGVGMNNYTQRTILLFVEKAWFETLWFKLAMVAVVLAMIYSYIRFRTKYLERKNLDLEQMVYTRTQNLQSTLQELKKANCKLENQIKKQTGIVASISHDVRTPLTFIIKIADNIRNMLKTGRYDKVEPMVISAQETSLRMKQLLDNLVGYIKIDSFQRVDQKENINLHGLVEAQFALFNQTYKKYPNLFINDIPKEIAIHANRQQIEIIIRNLIDNANKYTYKGKVHVHSQENVGGLHVFISDSGSGIPEALASWLSHSPDQPTEEVPAEMKGLGLIIVKEICELAGIAVHVYRDNGTQIRLCLENKDE